MGAPLLGTLLTSAFSLNGTALVTALVSQVKMCAGERLGAWERRFYCGECVSHLETLC